MATIKKAVKKAIAKKVMDKMAPMMKGGGTLSPSKNAVSKNISNLNKAKDGTSFKKLAPPYDKATYADKIAGAKKNAGEAKNGKAMKKANYGSSMMMSKGGKMMMGGKCKNGC